MQSLGARIYVQTRPTISLPNLQVKRTLAFQTNQVAISTYPSYIIHEFLYIPFKNGAKLINQPPSSIITTNCLI